nr:glycosyltransferase [Cytophagales bacterium]
MDYSKEPSVAIILVNWNGYLFTSQCLRSLEEIDYPPVHVIVVDNGSSDDSLTKLQGEFPDHTFLRSEENLGFAAGNNLGISYALEKNFEYVMLLNNDTQVAPDFLSKLLYFLRKHPDKNLGVVQPLILYNHDRTLIWNAGGVFKKITGASKTLLEGKVIDDANLKNAYPVDWITGCCMLLSAACIRTSGLMNPSYFAYFEDVDWSLRIRKNNYSLYVVPSSKIFHEAGASSKSAHAEGTLHPVIFYYTSRNQLFQVRQHVDFPFFFLAMAIQVSKLLLWMLYFLLRGRKKKLLAVFYGIRDGLRLNMHDIPVSWRRNYFL